MPIEHSETFCIWPWAGLEVNADGSTRPCCNWNGNIKDSLGREFSVKETDLESIRRSDSMQQLRRSLLQGQRPESCDQCWRQEQIPGRRSLRLDTNNNHSDLLSQNNFTEDPSDFKLIGVALGNICNLRCRICGPWASSVWTKDELQAMPRDQQEGTMESHMLKAGQWPRHADLFWESFQESLINMKEVHLYGGEPLLIPQQLKTLDFLVKQGISVNQKLVYNTNGTVFPEEIVEKWRSFREVDICISIDNLGEKFEYERNLSNWNQVVDNLDRFIAVQNENKNIRLKCVVTVSVFNIMDLVDIAQWIETKNFKEGIFWNVLHVMECFCINRLPVDVKKYIGDHLRKELTEKSTRYRKDINDMLAFMEIDQQTPEDYRNLIKEITRIDHQRKQWLGNSHPNLARLLKILPPLVSTSVPTKPLAGDSVPVRTPICEIGR